MVRVNYLGIGDPKVVFRRFAVWRGALADLRLRCFPMKEDYLALDALIKALDATATHFTGEEDFYGKVAVCFSMKGVSEPPGEYEH